MSYTWFINPDDTHRGTDFWMLNDALEEGELRAQLRSMRAQGVASVIVRTYIGLRSDYPGKDFMRKMRAVVDEARALDMTLFMQAGYMPEAVLDLPDEYSLKSINPYPAGECKGAPLDTFDGVDYIAEPTHTILDMLSPEAVRFYIKQSYEDMWADFKAEFGKTIVSIWVDEPSYAHARLPWTDALPDVFKALWGYAFPMDKLHLLFVDGEGAPILRYRYWRTVLKLLKDAYFYEVKAWCKANGLMFSGHLMKEEYMESQLLFTCFTMPLYKYFDLPGIDYLTCELNWRYGEIKPDMTRQKADLYTTVLQCTSAAHQAGQERILCEMYGVSSENLSLRDQKHIFDRFCAMGVNHRSVHGIFYSLRGRGKRAYPPHVNAYQPYWSKYKLLTDIVARESAFIRQGKAVRDVLLLHPMDSAFCEYRPKLSDGAHNLALENRDQAFLELLRMLTGTQVNFELGDEDTMAEMGSVEGNALVIGEMRYRTVVLPDMLIIRESTLNLLEAFAARGGRVIALGGLPRFTDGADDGRKARDISALTGARVAANHSELSEMLSQAQRSYSYEALDDASAIQIHYRERGQDKILYIMNIDCREGREGVLRVNGAFDAHSLDAQSGMRVPLPAFIDENGDTRVRVRMSEGGALLLELTPARSGAPCVQSRANSVARTDLTGEWTLKRDDPNALVMEFARYSINGAELSKPYPILGIQSILTQMGYAGDILLNYSIDARIHINGALLALESPEHWAISLDGCPISSQPRGYYRASAFETIALPDIVPGVHAIELRGHFEPLAKPTSAAMSIFENLGGVELEPMLLLGDFAVKSVIQPGVSGCVRFDANFRLTKETERVGDEIIHAGYPFYAGTMRLTRKFTLADGVPKRVCVGLDGMYAAVAEAFVNGARAGDFICAPYELDITRLARAGENELTIVVYNTLRNLLGPWHRPEGEIGACWPGYLRPNKPWLGAPEGGDAHAWMEVRTPDKPNWTESYLVLPLGIVRAHILTYDA